MKIHGTMTTSSKTDYLSILGLSNDFHDLELKKAFRREARKWHPDLNKNDINAEERFKLINEAYEFLRDPKKREILKKSQTESKNGQMYATGFPEFEDYLSSFYGFQKNDNHQTIEDETEFQDNFNEYDNYEYPATSPEEPPPIKSFEDVETIIEFDFNTWVKVNDLYEISPLGQLFIKSGSAYKFVQSTELTTDYKLISHDKSEIDITSVAVESGSFKTFYGLDLEDQDIYFVSESLFVEVHHTP